MPVINDTQFNIIIYLPKTVLLNFDDLCQQLDNAFKMYQQHVESDMHWYLLKNSSRAKPEELVHSAAGFTDFGLKKLSFTWKKINKNGDAHISLMDGTQNSVGQVVSYTAMKAFSLNNLIKSNISFFFTKPEDSQTLNQIIAFVTGLASIFTDNYIAIDLRKGFNRPDYLFPTRFGCSLIAYIPSPLQASDHPEAYQVIPINKEDKQVGTVIVSLDHFPDRENTEDVKTINRIDLRLREADLLPMGVNL